MMMVARGESSSSSSSSLVWHFRSTDDPILLRKDVLRTSPTMFFIEVADGGE